MAENKKKVHFAVHMAQSELEAMVRAQTKLIRQTGRPISLSGLGRAAMLTWAEAYLSGEAPLPRGITEAEG
jgi:hypothetical protein